MLVDQVDNCCSPSSLNLITCRMDTSDEAFRQNSTTLSQGCTATLTCQPNTYHRNLSTSTPSPTHPPDSFLTSLHTFSTRTVYKAAEPQDSHLAGRQGLPIELRQEFARHGSRSAGHGWLLRTSVVSDCTRLSRLFFIPVTAQNISTHLNIREVCAVFFFCFFEMS